MPEIVDSPTTRYSLAIGDVETFGNGLEDAFEPLVFFCKYAVKAT